MEDLVVTEQSNKKFDADIDRGQDQQNSQTAPPNAPEQGPCGALTSAADELGQGQQNSPIAPTNAPEQGPCDVVTPAEELNDRTGSCGKGMRHRLRRNCWSLVNTVFGGIRCIISCVECVQESDSPEFDIAPFLDANRPEFDIASFLG